MQSHTVIVLGGYGVFGARIVRSLARHTELDVIVAGRSHESAAALCASMTPLAARPLQMDCERAESLASLVALSPAVVVDTVGPFQARDYALARRCAEASIHYVNIADGREHVVGIAELDALARQHDALIVAGASTVPAVSTAVVDALADDPAQVLGIEVGISPGHRGPRGMATSLSILRYCGKAIPRVVGGGFEYGWGGLTRHRYSGPVGERWLSHVDVPERALWKHRYPNLDHATVRAGLELGFLHLGLSALSRLVRIHLLPSLVPCAPAFLRVADGCNRFGSDAGAMHVSVTKRSAAPGGTRKTWTVIAEAGDGPQIPVTPAVLVVKKLLSLPGYTPLTVRGALPCLGLITLEEILSELRDLSIRAETSD